MRKLWFMYVWDVFTCILGILIIVLIGIGIEYCIAAEAMFNTVARECFVQGILMMIRWPYHIIGVIVICVIIKECIFQFRLLSDWSNEVTKFERKYDY